MYERCKKAVKSIACLPLICLAVLLWGMKPVSLDENWKWIQRCLLQSFNEFAEAPLKKWDLTVSSEGFFRLRKYFTSGKQEYFAFRLNKIKSLNYVENADSGMILFETVGDDIIVQTYNDPKGNIDSMSTVLSLTVLKIDTQTFDTLKIAVSKYK